MTTSNDPQSLIEYLAAQVTGDSLPGLTEDKINAFLEIFDQLNEVYQGHKSIEDIPNIQEYINDLKDVSLKIKEHPQIYGAFRNLTTLFATKINDLNIVLQPPKQENDAQPLIESLVALLSDEGLPGFDEEKITALGDTIDLINDVYQGYKQVKDIIDFPGKIDELKAFLAKSNNNQQINGAFMDLLKLFAKKISEIDSIFEPVDSSFEPAAEKVDVQPLFESFVTQLDVNSLPGLTEDKMNEIFDTVDLINDVYQGYKKIQEIVDFGKKVNDLKDFLVKSKENPEIHKTYSNLLKAFGTKIKEITLIAGPMTLKNDAQPLIEELVTQVNTENFPELNEQKIAVFQEIIENLNEIYQGYKKIDVFPNLQETIDELKELIIITEEHQEVNKNLLKLLSLFSSKINAISSILIPEDEQSENKRLFNDLIAQIHPDNLPYLLQEQIDDLFVVIKKFDKIYRGVKVNDQKALEDLIDKARGHWLKVRDHKESNKVFVGLISLFSTKVPVLKEVLKAEELEIATEDEKKMEELSNKPRLSALELIKEKKKILDCFEGNPRATLKSFYKYKNQLEALGISMSTIDIAKLYPKEISRFKFFPTIKKLEELKDLKLEKEKIFEILIDLLPEAQSNGLLRAWRDVNLTAPIIQEHEDIIRLFVHTETKDQFLRAYLHHCVFQDTDLSKDEASQIKKVFKVHNPQSLDEEENLDLLREFWAKLTQNETMSKLVKLIISEAEKSNPSLSQIINEIEKKSSPNSKAQRSQIYRGSPEEVAKPDEFEERKLSDSKKDNNIDVMSKKTSSNFNFEEPKVSDSKKDTSTDVMSKKGSSNFNFEETKVSDSKKDTITSFLSKKSSSNLQSEPELISRNSSLKDNKLKKENADNNKEDYEVIEYEEEKQISMPLENNIQGVRTKPFETYTSNKVEVSSKPSISREDRTPKDKILSEPVPQNQEHLNKSRKDESDFEPPIKRPSQEKSNLTGLKNEQIEPSGNEQVAEEVFKASQPKERTLNQGITQPAKQPDKLQPLQDDRNGRDQHEQAQNQMEMSIEIKKDLYPKLDPIEDIKPYVPIQMQQVRKEDEAGFRQHVEQLMKSYREKDGSETKKLSTLLANIDLTNSNVMNSALKSELTEKKDVYTLLSENEYLHYFYRNPESIKDQPLLREIELKKKEFFKSVEQILTDYCPQDLETPEKIVEMKRRIGFELQVLLCLPMNIYVVLRLWKGITWQDLTLCLNMFARAHEDEADNLKFEKIDNNMSHCLFKCSVPLSKWKNCQNVFKISLIQALSNTRSIKFTEKVEKFHAFNPVTDYHNLFVFNVDFMTANPPAQGYDEYFEAYVMFAHFLEDKKKYDATFRLELLNQLKYVPFNTNVLNRVFFGKNPKPFIDLIDTGFDKNGLFYIFLIGKMISWKDIIKEESSFCLRLTRLYDCFNLSELLKVVLKEEIVERKIMTLNYIKASMVVRVALNNFKDRTSLFHYAEKLDQIELFDDEALDFVIKIMMKIDFKFEDDRKRLIQLVAPAITRNLGMSNTTKLKHMISLYDKLLVTDPFSSLNQISKALSNVGGGNENFRVDYETTKIIGQIFYNKSDFWTKIGRDERTKLYKFLSSDEIALELKLTIEQSNIKKYFNEYLEGIFKTTQIQDVEFLKLVFIDSYNPDFVDYKLKDFVTRFLSRGFVQRNYTLSNHISMLFLETILFPFFINQNYDDKQISNNLKKWRELVSNDSDDLLNIFDNLFTVAETNNNNAKFLEEVADQVCPILLDGYSYLTMATGKTIKTAVEWKSIALKEGYFNNLFLKLENSEHEKSTKKFAADTLIELVLNHKNLPEDLKNSVINRISIAFANEITYEDVRNTIVKDPSSSRLYRSLLQNKNKTKNEKLGLSIKTHLEKVAKELKNCLITFGELNTIRKYSKKDKELMLGFLEDAKIDIDFENLLNILYVLVDDLTVKMQKLDYFLEFFSDNPQIKARKGELSKLSENLNDTLLSSMMVIWNEDNIKSLNLQQRFEKFASIAFKTEKLLVFPFFMQFLAERQDFNDDELIHACEQAYEDMVSLFSRLIQNLKAKTLKMSVIKKYFFNLQLDRFEEEMKEISNHVHAAPADLALLKKALRFYLQYSDFVYLSKSLIDLDKIVPLKSEALLKSAAEYNKIAHSIIDEKAVEQILVSDFIQRADDLSEHLANNDILKIDKIDPINQIIHELSTGKELCQFLNRVQRDNINELKDFVNDQEESLINGRVIKGFEYVWNFKANVIDKSNGLKDFINRCSKMLQGNDGFDNHGFDDIQVCIRECVTAKTLLERTYDDMMHREATFKFRIMEIMQSSIVQIIHMETDKKDVNVIPTPEGKAVENFKDSFSLKGLNDFKDKALLVINSKTRNEEEKNDNIVDFGTLKRFTEFIDALNVILASYEELENLGFFHKFIDNQQKDMIEFKIAGGNFDQIERYKKSVQEYTREFSLSLSKLYSQSYIFAHFYGRQLKRLHKTIMKVKGWEEYAQNLASWSNLDFVEFKNMISTNLQIPNFLQRDPIDQLGFIKDLLEKIAGKLDLDDQFDYDDGRPKVKLVEVRKENVFLGMLAGIPEEEMLKAKLNQILFCHYNTNPLEVTCFLHRAFLNGQKMPHFVVGVDDLSASLQNHFCETIESLLKTLKPFKKNVNLIVIGSATTEKVYNYLYHHKEFKRKVFKNLVNEKKCFETLFKMAPKFQIVVSKTAGLGKTHAIFEECKAKNLKPLCFPLAGNITEDRIGERLAAIEVNENTGLVLQIHNVIDKKILDEVLFQLIFFRSLRSDRHLFFPNHKFHLYIELQNLLGENYLESIRSLSIFVTTEMIVGIPEVDHNKLKIEDSDSKFHFVMHYMKAMEEQKIADTDITYHGFIDTFKQNKPGSRVDLELCKRLLKKHFFEPLKDVNPSFIQLRFFIDIFYSALRTFGGSPFLETAALLDSFRDFKPKEITKVLRSDFLRILMENSRQFIKRTVSINDFSTERGDNSSKGINFGEELRNFPLLIMRQGEKEDEDFCYSFVYNDIEKVPLEIKKFVLAQELGNAMVPIWTNNPAINNEFKKNDLATKTPAQLLELLKMIAGRQQIKPDETYAITLDNFYKMCLIIQRMRSRIPIIIMGETGVGKTALIRFLVENIYGDELLILNIHAGVNEKDLIDKKNKILERLAQANGRRLWVFFDEFNTSEELGYISEVLSSKRFLGEQLDENIIFLGACNPFRKREVKKNVEKVGIEKNKKINNGDLLYKVLPPPESLIEAMWNYQELREAETLEYIRTMLKMNYRIDKVVEIIHYTHNFIKENIEKSAVSLRDVDRFRRLYDWFFKTMPDKRAINMILNRYEVFSNYNMDRSERAFILTISFCYYMRLPTVKLRQEFVDTVEKKMGFNPGYILQVLENEQIDLLTRMELPPGTALNRALRENVFSTFVCLMNKIPIIIVGMPGCSKSLSIRLLCTNLRGQNSYEEYFKTLYELSMVHFQGSESVTSEGVEKVFDRASKNLKLGRVIPTILFDEIGLAEVSVHNPLKVLHAKLEGRPEISFIGLSNWELDAAKMGRFLVVARPLPDVHELHETAVKIFESILGNGADAFTRRIQTLSNSYFEFIKTWRQKTTSLYPDFFGLRDFYSLIKYISNKIKTDKIVPENRQDVAKMLRRGIERNFDGQAKSVDLFLEKVRQDFYDPELEEKDELDVLSLINENLNDPDARCLLLIIRGEALIHMVSQTVKTDGKNVITIHGSTFGQDKQNEQYNIRVLSEVINHVEKGNVIIFKDVNNSIQTSLYDLYNKAYQRIGGKNYCRVAVGANYNPKCFVHPNFNCIVYINEGRLEDIDPPFLNRFEKHYLTLDRFLGDDELQLFRLLKEWINKIMGKYLNNKNSALKQDNFIINSSEEAIASLCIKALQSTQKVVPQAEGMMVEQDNYIERALKKCKEIMLKNATIDFGFLIETVSEIKKDKKEYEFIRETLDSKYRKSVLQLCKESSSHLIIFTYDQDINQGFLPNGIRIRNFKMVNMRCEKDIKDEIDAYFKEKEELCIITLDYETEAVHLSLLLFLIDNAEKMREGEAVKDFIIILHYSRIAAANSDEKPLHTISFLNGWSQVFLEKLSEPEKVKIDVCTSIHPLIENQTINLTDLFLETFQNCIKRFEIKFASEIENARSLPDFMIFLLETTENTHFQIVAARYLDKRFKDEQKIGIDFRKEIINSKDFANLAWNVDEAAKLYANKKGEEYCAMMMKYLFENEAFISMFPKYGTKLLDNYVPGIQRKLQNAQYNYELTQKIMGKVLLSTNQRQRVPNLVEVFMEYPKLFPCSKLDQGRFFSLNKTEDNDESLYSIAIAIHDLECRVAQNRMEKELRQEEEKRDIMENRQNIEEEKHDNLNKIEANDNQDEIQFNAWNTKFKHELEKITCLNTFEDGKLQDDMLAELENSENALMKELYLIDMRNEFIEKIAKTSLTGSILLDRIIRKFLGEEFKVVDYLLVLLRGEGLWNNLLQIFNIVSSVVTDQGFIEELFLPELNINIGFEMGVMLDAQTAYVDAFFNKCNELFSPKGKNIQKMNGSKSYAQVFTNIYFWLIKLQIQFSKFGVVMPIKVNIWKNFVELIESVSKQNNQQIYQSLDVKLGDNDDEERFFIIIDDFLQEFIKGLAEEDKAQVSKFQATVLFRFWVNNRTDEEGDKELAKRLLERINQDKYFPNFCSNIVDSLISTDNQAEIFKNLGDLDDYILLEFSKSIESSNYNNNLSTIITDFFDKLIEDPEIIQIREGESEASELLMAQFAKFSEHWTLIENQQQRNHLQVLYIMAHFKHYMRSYVQCLIEDVPYKVLRDVDNLLSRKNFLGDSLAIFTLKLLRIKLESYKKLERFLFEIRKMTWIEKFEHSFQEIPARSLFVPTILNLTPDQVNVQNKWNELMNSDLSNEALFTQLITLAGKDHHTRYILLNLFLTNAYVGSISQIKVNRLKELIQKYDALMKQHLNEYQISLINCYINTKVDQHYLQMLPELDAEEVNVHILILNCVNWMVCLNNFVSPLTGLFFSNGKIPANLSEHLQNLFVIAGIDNPFIECAQRAREACRYRGVYICSAQCKYIYTVEGCGWTNETKFCPFCCENIGNADKKTGHTLARVDKGARRLGPVIPDWNSRYYLGNAEFHADEKYWADLETSIDAEIDIMREEKTVKTNQGRANNPNFVNLIMTGYNRITEKVRGEVEIPPLTRIKRLTDHFLRFILHSILYVVIALKWINPQEAIKVVPAQDANKLLEYLKDNIQTCLKKMRENLDCNDSLVWILAMEQMMSTIVQNNNNNNFGPNVCKNRDNFEKMVEQLLDSNLGENKINIIRTYKKTSQVIVQKLDSILCEEEVSPDYRYLKLLRHIKLPSLDNMLNDYMDVIKTKYPILDECIKNMQQIEKASKLVNIVRFSNELMKLVDFQVSRKDAEETEIGEFVERLPREKVGKMSKLLDAFLESWNSLELGPIQVGCKIVGTTARYDKKSPVVAFLEDSMQGKNQYGKILSGVIYNLSEEQNNILNQISGRAKNIKQFQNIKFFDDKEVIPQSCGPQDILDLKQEILEGIVNACSSNNHAYGNGVAAYDFEAIQFNLILKIMGKKLLLQKLEFYPNVKFSGEAFAAQSKFSSHILDIRKLGLTNAVPNLADLEDKFRRVKEISKNQFYSKLKHVLGSLEKIMIFYKTLTVKNVSISRYVQEFRFNAISKLIFEEEPIKSYDISVIVSLYEAIEKISTPYIWRVIPNIFKAVNLTDDDKKQLERLFREIQDEKDDTKTLPSIADIATAISRFAARCLVLDDENEPRFKPTEEVMLYLKEKYDVWPYPGNDDHIENLAFKFPKITFDKIFSLNEYIQNRLNPEKEEGKKGPVAKDNKETIPDKPVAKKKANKMTVFI